MSDWDDDNSNSGGIIGSIISILILAAIWPYLLALLGLCIAYLVAVAILGWIAENLWFFVLMVLGALSIYAVLRYRLIAKAWQWIILQFRPKAHEVHLAQNEITESALDLPPRKFIPSTNLYCYWCTKKLGIQAFELNGKYYCASCKAKQLRGSK